MNPLDLYSGASALGQGLAQVWNFNPTQQLANEEDILTKQLKLQQEMAEAQRKRDALLREAEMKFRREVPPVTNVVPEQMGYANSLRAQIIQTQNDLLSTPEGLQAVRRFGVGQPTVEDIEILRPYQDMLRAYEVLKVQAENTSRQAEEYRKAYEAGHVLQNPNAEAYLRGAPQLTFGGLGTAGVEFDLQKAIGNAIEQLVEAAPEYASAWANADSEGRRRLQEATMPQREAFADTILNDARAQDKLVAQAIQNGYLQAGATRLTPDAKAKLKKWLVEQINRRQEEAYSELGAGARAEAGGRGVNRAESVPLFGEVEIVPDEFLNPQHRGSMLTTLPMGGVFPRSGYTGFATGAPRSEVSRTRMLGFDMTRGAFNASSGQPFMGDRSQLALPGELRVVAYVEMPNGQRQLLSRKNNPEAFATGRFNGAPIQYSVMQEVQIPEGRMRTRTVSDEDGRETTITEPESTRSVVVEPQFLQGIYNPETVRQLREYTQQLNQDAEYRRRLNSTAPIRANGTPATTRPTYSTDPVRDAARHVFR